MNLDLVALKFEVDFASRPLPCRYDALNAAELSFKRIAFNTHMLKLTHRWDFDVTIPFKFQGFSGAIRRTFNGFKGAFDLRIFATKDIFDSFTVDIRFIEGPHGDESICYKILCISDVSTPEGGKKHAENANCFYIL